MNECPSQKLASFPASTSTLVSLAGSGLLCRIHQQQIPTQEGSVCPPKPLVAFSIIMGVPMALLSHPQAYLLTQPGNMVISE